MNTLASGLVGDRYLLGECLDSDLRGLVYAADDMHTGARVAIKLLPNASAEGLYRLKREFRIVRGARHPNLVRLLELDTLSDPAFIAMELLDGVALDRYADGLHGRARLEALAHCLLQLACAIQTLHGQGVLHRDLKPRNVMVVRGGRIVLLDFGLSTTTSGLPEAAERTGTRGFAAPEQLAGEADFASDWYSFGILLAATIGDAMRHAPLALRDLAADLGNADPHARPQFDAIVQALHQIEVSPVDEPGFEHYLPRPDAERWLHEQVELARNGRAARVACVAGEPGIGKSTLLQRFLAAAQTRSDRPIVLCGACHADENVAFNGFDNVVDDLTRYLIRLPPDELHNCAAHVGPALLQLFPVLARVPGLHRHAAEAVAADPGHTRSEGIWQLRLLLQSVAHRTLPLIWIDDWHWADTASWLLFKTLIAAPDSPRLLLLLSQGADQRVHEEVTTLCKSHHAPVHFLHLDGLDGEQTDELSRALHVPRSVQPAELGACRGNPMLIKLLHGFPDGRLADALNASQLTLLRVCAIAGRPLPVDVLAACGATATMVDHLVRRELLRAERGSGGQLVTLHHEHIGRLALVGLDTPARRALHATLASALEADHRTGAMELVSHYLAAGARAEALAHCSLAADEASAALDFENAERLYVLAFELGGSRCADWGRIAAAGRAAANAGAGVRAGMLLDKAAALAKEAGADTAPTLRAEAATQYLYAGAFEPARQTLTAIAQSAHLDITAEPVLWRSAFVKRLPWMIPRRLRSDPERIPEPEVARRLDLLGALARGISLIDHTRYHDVALTWLHESARFGDPVRFSQALGMEAVMQSIIGGLCRRSSHRLLRRAIELADDTPYMQASVLIWQATVAFNESHWRRCADLAGQAEAIMVQHGSNASWELSAIHAWLYGAQAMLGDIDPMRRSLPRHLEDARRRGDSLAINLYATSLCAMLPLALDVPEQVLDMDRVEHAVVNDVYSSHDFYRTLGIALTHFYCGEPHAASDFIESQWPRIVSAGFLQLELLGKLLWYLRLRALIALNGSTVHVKAGLVALRRTKLPVARPLLAVLEASRATRAGDRERALAYIGQAISGFAEREMRLFQLAAERRRAELSGTPVDPVDAQFVALGVVNPARMTDALVP